MDEVPLCLVAYVPLRLVPAIQPHFRVLQILVKRRLEHGFYWLRKRTPMCVVVVGHQIYFFEHVLLFFEFKFEVEFMVGSEDCGNGVEAQLSLLL